MPMRLLSGEVGGGQRRGRHTADGVCVAMSFVAFLMTLAIASAISLDEALLADMIPPDPDDPEDIYPSTYCQDPGTTVSECKRKLCDLIVCVPVI